MVKVSIIVPVYKVEKFIKECIESLINQTLKEIEIILVDDGSPDNSGSICDEFAKKDDRIKVIHQKNSGVSTARNAGLEKSTGDWIVFVDGDDWVENNMIEEMYNLVSNTNYDVGICAYYINETKKQYKKGFFSEDKNFQNENDRIRIIKKVFSNLGVPWAKIYSKDLIIKNNIKFKEGLKRMQDSIFNFYIFQNSKKVIYIDKPLYHYRQFDESACFKYSPQFEETAIKIIESTKEFIDKYELSEVLDSEMSNRKLKLYIETIKLKYIPSEADMGYREKIKNMRKLKMSPIYNNFKSLTNYKELNMNYKIGAFLVKLNAINLLYFYYKFIYIVKKHKRYQ